MDVRRAVSILVVASTVMLFPRIGAAQDQPLAIFHAFDQSFADVESYVCEVAQQGYSHLQITPVQKSNPSDQWWARYQPVDYSVIEGKGSEADLKRLVRRAHDCGMKVIADVVFNHMANMEQYKDLNFPKLGPANFHPPCAINYNDGNRDTEVNCWLGVPDLDQEKTPVQNAHKAHLKKLLGLGIDGFRFDAAKHMTTAALGRYIDYINQQSKGKAWNYLEVIEDGDTKGEDYNKLAAVTDFRLYRSVKKAFTFGGDLRSLVLVEALDDPRSTSFGRNHDNIREISANAIDPYGDRSDSFLATAFILAREGGTPLVLNWDNLDSQVIRTGVKFRQIITQRKRAGANTKETVLRVIDSPTVLLMERGPEGFFVVNKGTAKFDQAALDMSLTNLEGCYRELRNNFNVAIERRDDKKFVTRWGTWSRGGIEVNGRDALFFIREPWSQCQTR